MVQVMEKIYPENMDDRKRQGKSTENVGLVSKIEPLKPISCGHCGKPGLIITNLLEVR